MRSIAEFGSLIQLCKSKSGGFKTMYIYGILCFIREISIMANLDHPNLIEFVGFSLPTHKSKKFKIYSKFMPNNNLLSILKRDE
ncbi:protein kinase, partial [Helicobacter typhlonius]|uniref:protein kinase n=2 Tax=Helicobacter typhlonius TaxID=76936 RepID=UPI002FE429C2